MMQPIVTISGHDISISDQKGKHVLPPYFYYDHGHVLIGKPVEQAIDLFPMSIYNIFTEIDDKKLEAFCQAFHDHVHNFHSKSYHVRVDAHLTQLCQALKTVVPEVTLQTIPPRVEKHLSPDQENQLRHALSIVIANYLTNFYHLSGCIFHKIKRIVGLRIDDFLKELIEKGTTLIQMKVVDERSNVHVLHQNISTDIPAIAQMIELYKPSISNREERLMKVLYDMYDHNLKVTFISPFSFGKSTLINGLLGDKVLKMDIRAETAILTKVVSADANRLFVKYDNDRIIMHTYVDGADLSEKLAKLTSVRSEELPSEVQIHHTSVHLPRLTLIDAPGLNSRYVDHNEKAVEAFRMSDTVLFLINPTHIGESHFAKQIKEMLDLIKKDNKKYGVVLSKLDLYSDDYEVIMKELEIVLHDLDPAYKKDNVFFVSGYFALYGKLLRDDKIDVRELRKMHGMFVLEGDEIISGRAIEKYHAHSLLEFSQIGRLERFIQERGESHDSNERNLDRGELAAAGQS